MHKAYISYVQYMAPVHVWHGCVIYRDSYNKRFKSHCQIIPEWLHSSTEVGVGRHATCKGHKHGTASATNGVSNVGDGGKPVVVL